MADPTEPDAGGATTTAEPAAPTDARRPSGGLRQALDRRTVAICLVLGVIAAIVTVLIASAVTSNDDGDGMVLQEPIDEAALLAQPLDTPDGGTTDLASFQEDQPMVVNLWQAACAPCVDEMPLLNAAQADNPDLTFVGVNTQEDLEDARALAEQTKISYPWVLDPDGEFYFNAGGQGMPTTLLLAADGSVIDSKNGSFDNASELQAFLDQAG